MIATFLRKLNNTPSKRTNTKLFNENTFYPSLLKDLKKCGAELIIESPFITTKRLKILLPELKILKNKRVRIALITKDPADYDTTFRQLDSYKALSNLQYIGVQVIYKKNLHRKLVIIDRKILYEGSLNILSQNNSCELMRRIESVREAWQMIGFTQIDKFIS